MRVAVAILLAVTSAALALDSFGAIRPGEPSAPEAQDASGHDVNNLYVEFRDTEIDDAHWPGESGTDLLYGGYFCFGIMDNLLTGSIIGSSDWRTETDFYYDENWPTEVPWGDVPPRYGDENILVYMTDAESYNPLGVRLRQHSFGFADGLNEDCIFILWTIYNAQAGYLENAVAGLFMDMDVGDSMSNIAGYDFVRYCAYMYDNSESDRLYFALTMMGTLPGNFHGWTINDDYYDDYDAPKYAMLSQEGRFQELPDSMNDWRILLGYKLHDLAQGETWDYAVALTAGEDMLDIISNTLAARMKWNEIFGDGSPEPSIPPRVTLSAPWPCPAREQASFDLALVEPGDVEVALYDLSGRRVDTIYDGYMAAGRNELTAWTGGLSPGVYLIQAATEGGAAVRRLVVAR